MTTQLKLRRLEIAGWLLIAVLLRLGVLWLTEIPTDKGDAFWYARLATNLMNHQVLSLDEFPPLSPTIYRPPLYPALLALLWSVTGVSTVVAQLGQVLVSGLTVVLLALGTDAAVPGLGRWSAGFAALSPTLAAYTGALLPEVWCSFFLVAAMVAPWLLQGWRGFAVLGICLGLACLTRDVFLAAVPLLMVGLLVAPLRRFVCTEVFRPTAMSGAFLLVGALIVISPWTARNHTQTGIFAPVTKGILGQGLWIGAWEVDQQWLDNGGFRDGPPVGSFRSPAERIQVEHALTLKDVPRDQAMKQLAFQRYREEPLSVAGRWMRRLPAMWTGTGFAVFPFRPSFLARGTFAWTVLKSGLWAINFVMLLMAIFGVGLAWRHHRQLLWFATPLLYTMAVFMPLHNVEQRYSYPVTPFLLGLAAYAAYSGWNRWRPRA